jgi:hypothetical protein
MTTFPQSVLDDIKRRAILGTGADSGDSAVTLAPYGKEVSLNELSPKNFRRLLEALEANKQFTGKKVEDGTDH